MIRKTIFWLHLGTGVAAGLVIAMMSLTGVLLTFEHQLISWADEKDWPVLPTDAERIPVAEIADAAAGAGVPARQLTFYAQTGAPVRVGGGRRDPSTYVDAYTGAVLGTPDNSVRDIMSLLTRWHRWFDADGAARDKARLVTGVSNLAFLFLLVSGAYLWLPKVMRWPLFRERLRFASAYRTWRDRDFYWHHIFGAWSLVPLIVVVATAVVFSFSWANDLVFRLAGSEAPQPSEPATERAAAEAQGADRISPDDLLQHVMGQSADWSSITMQMPEADSPTVSFEVDNGTGRQPHKRNTVVLDAYTGAVVGKRSFRDQPAGNRARVWIRYLHTGEALGVIGQLVAGAVSLVSLFLVWTGLALAWRRLIVPLYRAS